MEQAPLRECQAEVKNGMILFQAPLAFRQRALAIPGARVSKTLGAYLLPATPGAADALFAEFAESGLVFDAAIEQLLGEAHRVKQAQEWKTRDDLPEIPGLKTRAWDHQRRAFWFVVHCWGGLPTELEQAA